MASAQWAHDKFHLNVTSLRLTYKISKEQALKIVKASPLCAELAPVPYLGVNSRGLLPNHIWQMDVTPVTSFGKLGFVHVSVDTYPGMLFASSHSGAKVKDVKSHWIQAFAYMGP